MAKYERALTGDFDALLAFCEDAVLQGSMSASLEGGSQAVLFKVNTLGEESSLETLADAVEAYFP